MATDIPVLNAKTDGYRGLWYQNQPLDNEYVFKYSGGMGTYCAKHRPFAVYCPEVEKTFFCYGGVDEGYHERFDLISRGFDGLDVPGSVYHIVSYYDHRSRTVPHPTVLLDKRTHDAHDNPVISVDGKGYLWIFSTAHGTSRPAFVHRSVKPYDIDTFERVDVVRETADGTEPVTNFSYMQPWHVGTSGFALFFTIYEDGERKTCFASSADGRTWTRWTRLADIEKGHYQVSAATGTKAGTSFNYHPDPKGLNWRTNLYYLETRDMGRTWLTASGEEVTVPVTTVKNPALVHDYEAEGLLVYMKDLVFDDAGYPIILYETSRGFESGPESGPRTWCIARWDGRAWKIHAITTSDSNYDMGTLHIDGDGLRLVAPTETGPQPYNPGGEVAMWVSRDGGETWKKERQLTGNSPRNHTYVRRPVNAHPDFYAFWADGNGRAPSESHLYFSDMKGQVFELPYAMSEKWEHPKWVPVQ